MNSTSGKNSGPNLQVSAETRSNIPALCGEPLDSAFWYVVALAVLSGVIRGWIAAHLELFQDEALYWYIGAHAPLTFSPHPPGTPFLAWLGTVIVGKTELGVRLGNVLLGSLVLPLFYFLGRRVLGSSVLAGWATLAFAVTPIYFGFGAICTPDMPQLFWWVALLYVTVRAYDGEEHLWPLAGVVLALGLYFKYILVLYVPALLIFFLWGGGERLRLLRSRPFWLGVVLSILLFFPVALWRESQTGWDAVAYHLRDRQDFQLTPLRNALVYFGIHLAYYSPLFYAFALAGLTVAAWRCWQRREWRLAFLATFGGVPFLFFALISVVTRRELSREQWDAPAYVCGLLAGAWFMRELYVAAKTPVVRQRLHRVAQLGFALAVLTVLLMTAEALTTFPSQLLGRSPLFSAMVGWRTLGNRVDDVLSSAPADAPHVVLGNSFIPAMQIAFYSKSAPRVFTLEHSLNRRYGLKGVIERTGMSLQTLLHQPGVDAIFVSEGAPSQDTTRSLTRLKERLLQYFDSVEPLPPVSVMAHGREIERFYLLHCRRLRGTGK